MKPEFHLEALPKAQLKVWNQINTEAKYLKANGYYLAGGTGLALQLGHRRSVDFDFFSRKHATAEGILSRLKRFPSYLLRERDADTAHVEISGVKLSFIGAYQYDTVKDLIQQAIKAIDKAAQKGIIKPNTGKRKKSRLMKKFNTMISK